MLMRYPQELVDVAEFEIPSGSAASHRVTKPEMQMARQLIESMATAWKPSDYKDEFRAKLHKAIEKRMKSKGVVTQPDEEATEEATTNVVDFMDLLKKSLASNKRTPASAKRASKAKPAKSPTTRKPRRKSA
jgi:DNA end-binding protein Ku